MANKIQIKRSTSNATVTGLSNGELAFTGNGNVFYIGNPANGSAIRIGGEQVPGTLTANQALVANSTSGIDKVIVANLVPTNIWANGAGGTAGQYLTSNSSGGVYWNTPLPGVAGSDTQVQFNDGGSLAGDAGLTYNKTTDTLSADKVAVVNTAASTNTTTGALTVAGGVGVAGRINVTDMAIGNDSVYATINNSVISTNNLFATGTVNGSVLSVGSWVVANQSGVFTSGGVNGSVIGVGTQFSVNTTQVSISQGMKLSANGALGSANQVLRTDASGTAYWADDSGDISDVTAGDGLTGGGSSGSVTLDVGAGDGIAVNATAVSVKANNGITSNADGVFVRTGTDSGLTVNTSGLFVEAGGGLLTNATGVHVGTGNGIAVEANSIRVQQANGIAVDSGGVRVDASGSGGLVANATGLHVIAGDGLLTNSTGLHIGAANGISVTANEIGVAAGSTLTVNTSGVHVNADLSITSITTSGDATVNGNTKLGDASGDVVSIVASVNTNIMPSANVTYNIGNNAMRWNEVHASNVHSVTGYFDGNVEVAGDLIVSGNVTTTNVNSVVISDPLIYLAGNNYSSDLVDIGFAGNYNTGSANAHTGLFRDATDGIYKLFKGLTQELSGATTVNVADPTFAIADLTAYLISGGLTTNATHVAITANSTVNVTITANTLTLNTPLAATSGGTGQNSYTSGDLLVANSGNVLSKLSLGSAGYVLQSNGSALVYDTLDGGVF